MVSNRSRFEQLLDTWEPRIRDAFLNAFADIKSEVVLKRFADRLERGDVAGAVEALQIDAEAFGRLEIVASARAELTSGKYGAYLARDLGVFRVGLSLLVAAALVGCSNQNMSLRPSR